MKRRDTYRAALHLAGDVFLIALAAGVVGLILFSAMVLGGSLP